VAALTWPNSLALAYNYICCNNGKVKEPLGTCSLGSIATPFILESSCAFTQSKKHIYIYDLKKSEFLGRIANRTSPASIHDRDNYLVMGSLEFIVITSFSPVHPISGSAPGSLIERVKRVAQIHKKIFERIKKS
jgi:hypothetical protein